MNILFASPWFPWPLMGGNLIRSYHLLRALGARHRVTLLAMSDRAGPRHALCPIDEICAQVIELDGTKRDLARQRRFDPSGALLDRLCALFSSPLPSYIRAAQSDDFVEALRRLRRSNDFDLVWAVHGHVAQMARTAGFRVIVVDEHDLDSERLGRHLSSTPFWPSKCLQYLELAKVCAFERSLARRCARVAVCKEVDRRFFGDNRRNVVLVPNGVEDCPATDPAHEQAGALLFVGSLDYYPNKAGVVHLVQYVLPLIRRTHPAATLTIVGRNPAPEVQVLHDGLVCFVHGNAPDLTPFYERASVVVAPLRHGTGTRLKILEALGHGKAVVATSLAALGLDLRPGLDLEIADQDAEFAQACSRLLDDDVRRRSLGASGRARALQLYNWRSIGQIACEVVESLSIRPPSINVQNRP